MLEYILFLFIFTLISVNDSYQNRYSQDSSVTLRLLCIIILHLLLIHLVFVSFYYFLLTRRYSFVSFFLQLFSWGSLLQGIILPPPPATLPFYKCCSTFADILLTESAIQIPSTTIIILPPLHWYSVFLLRTDILHTLSPMNELIFHSINKEEDNIVNTKAQQACLQPMKVPIRGKLTPEKR